MALAKLQTLYFGIGYPTKWQDYSGLAVDPLDAVGNLRRVAQRNYRNALARLGQPVDLTEWWIAPQTVGAMLVFQQNAYNFLGRAVAAAQVRSRGIGRRELWRHRGHHRSRDQPLHRHAGRGLRRRRPEAHWWTAEDLRELPGARRAAGESVFQLPCRFADTAVDGKLTLVENIADLGGLAAAFDAYRRTLGSRVKDKEYVRQQDRQFFIGFARSWRGKTREDALRRQLATDGHAPESFRISTVRNIDAWYDAFDVRPGQRLYLEPKARVRVW